MNSHPKVSAICVVIIEVILCLLIYLIFLCIRRRRCREEVLSSLTSDYTGTQLGPRESVLIFFPYSVIKSLSPQLDKALGSLQCAACLEEFKDGHDETLRFIPKCGHVFHTECTDPCAVLCPCCWAIRPRLGLNNGGDDGGGDGEDVVVEIIEKEPMIKLPDEVREKITVHGKLVLPRWEPSSPAGYRSEKEIIV